jgi:hypothetical protein
MYLGDMEEAHISPIRRILRLVWRFGILRHPVHAHVTLAPEQYTVALESGPLIRPLQQLLACREQYVLFDNWDKAVTADCFNHSWRGRSSWRRAWVGAAGLGFYPAFLPEFSHRFSFGVRFEEGFWYQEFASGYPVSLPAIIEMPESIGLVVGAHLDRSSFPRLPYDSDAARAAGLQHVRAYLKFHEVEGKTERYWEHSCRPFRNTTVDVQPDCDLWRATPAEMFAVL